MAGEGDAERLVVLLEARIRDFERNMQKASGSARRSYDEITAGSSRASRTMSKNMADAASKMQASLASFGKGFVGGLAAGAVAEFTTAIRGAVSSVAELQAQSQQAGVGVEAFQMLGAAATQAKVGTDALVDGLKEMQLRIDEFVVTGGGSAAESLKRLGYDAATLTAGLRDVPALFLDIIGRVQQLDQAARIRVLDELFGGTGGEQFIRLVDLGAEKVRAIGDEARDAGAVIDSELVHRAAVLDAQWSLMATTIRTEVVGAILQASAAMGPLIDQSNALGSSFDRFLNNPSWLNFNAFMLGGMVEKTAAAQARNGAPPTSADNAREMRRAQAFRERSSAPVLAEDRATRARTGDYTPPPVPQDNLPPTPYRPPNLLDYDPNAGSGRGGGAASRSASASAARSERDAVAELISSLEEELALVGKTSAEREVANNLRQAGAEATDEEKARIAELTKALADQEEAYRRNSEAAGEMKGMAKDALKGFISDLKSGKNAGEALLNALDRIADKLLDMAIDNIFSGGNSGGGLSGIVSAILGGGRGPGAPAAGGVYAEGGYTGPGGKYEPAGTVHRGEYVMDAETTRRIGVANLDAMRAGRRGLADGGAVGLREVPRSAPAAAPSFSVSVVNAAPNSKATTRETQTPDGGRRVEVMVDEAVASAANRRGGQTSRALAVMGAKPPTRKMG